LAEWSHREPERLRTALRPWWHPFTPWGPPRMRDLLERLEAATPAGRYRGLDGLRALAVLGVVLGHWLVTALVAGSGTVRVAGPLRELPQLAPLSWLFQTLAVFFLVGGWVAARGRTGSAASYPVWLGRRLARLFRPVAAVALVWTVSAVAMLAGGVGLDTVRALTRLVWSPLWFLLVFAVLTAVTPAVVRLSPVWPLAAVAVVDLIRYGLGGPEWLGWVNVLAACCAAFHHDERRTTGHGWRPSGHEPRSAGREPSPAAGRDPGRDQAPPRPDHLIS
ncbi:acyltransferase family protein, partial [Nonomuraea sp. NPDC004297]